MHSKEMSKIANRFLKKAGKKVASQRKKYDPILGHVQEQTISSIKATSWFESIGTLWGRNEKAKQSTAIIIVRILRITHDLHLGAQV